MLSKSLESGTPSMKEIKIFPEIISITRREENWLFVGNGQSMFVDAAARVSCTAFFVFEVRYY